MFQELFTVAEKRWKHHPSIFGWGVLMPRILSRSLRKFAFQLAHELWITLEFFHQQSHDLQGLPADVMFHSLDILVHGFGIEPKP